MPVSAGDLPAKPAYPPPVGAWLLTGTSLVPPPPYTAEAGDLVSIEIDGVGRLENHLVRSSFGRPCSTATEARFDLMRCD